MGYCIYGKRTKPVRYYSPLGSHLEGPDTVFRALDEHGIRMSSPSKAAIYDTREQALRVLKTQQRPASEGILLEIRKVS